MIIRKFIDGFVCQEFDSRTGKLITQYFEQDGDVEFIDENDRRVKDKILTDILNHPFEMKQPEFSSNAIEFKNIL